MLPELTAEEILAKGEVLEIVPTQCKELGGTIHLKELSGGDRDDWEREQVGLSKVASFRADPDLEDFRARFLRRCICDSKGVLLFGEKDVPRLSRIKGKVLDRLYTLARKLSGLDQEAQKSAEGNSGGGPSAASGTA